MPLAGDLIDIGDSFDDKVFTPAYGNVTLGSGAVNEGRYKQIGNFVFWQFRTEFGTGTAFSGTVTLTLPVPAWTGGGVSLQMAVGAYLFRDTSVPAHYAGTMAVFASDGLQCSFGGAWSGSVPNTRINATQPVTVAAGDILSGSGIYAVS